MVNKVILVGNLGKDPELKDLDGGQQLTKFPLATSSVYVNKAGEKVEETEWHNIVVWGKQAAACAKYLEKGRPVFVEGKIKTRSWDDADGNKKYMTEIVASDVKFLGSGKGGDAAAADESIPF